MNQALMAKITTAENKIFVVSLAWVEKQIVPFFSPWGAITPRKIISKEQTICCFEIIRVAVYLTT